MSTSIVYLSLLVLLTFVCFSCGTDSTTHSVSVASTTTTPSEKTATSHAANCTTEQNGTCIDKNGKNNETSLWDNVKKTFSENKGMLLRTFYVLIGLTSIVIVYFVIRAWRLRRGRNKSRKYGLITSRGSDLEMAPLDQGDSEDDEDMTVFELNNRRRK